MKRYASKIEDGTLYVEGRDGWIEVGAMDHIVDLVGGPTYRIEYDDYGRVADWNRSDEDGVLTFDVEETLRGMTYREEFVDELAAHDAEDGGADADGDDYPDRTRFYANRMIDIWDSKGNVSERE